MNELLQIHSRMTMQEIMEAYPSARRTLFQNFHLGGCASCGYSLSDTLEEVFVRSGRASSLDQAIQDIQESGRIDAALQMEPVDLKAALERGEDWTVIDVREPAEAAVASVEGSILLDRGKALEILEHWDRSARIVFYCHVGVRSLEAAIYFLKQGFVNVRNLSGGIDRWAAQVDPSIPRY